MIIKYSYPIWKKGFERTIKIHPECLPGTAGSDKYHNYLQRILLNRGNQIFLRQTFMIEVYKDKLQRRILDPGGMTIVYDVYDVRVFYYRLYGVVLTEMQFGIWTGTTPSQHKKLERLIDINDIVSYSFDQDLDKRRGGRAGPVAQMLSERSVMKDTRVCRKGVI